MIRLLRSREGDYNPARIAIYEIYYDNLPTVLT